MGEDSTQHHRRSARLQEYDYSWAGWYYVTICAKERRCIFGEIRNDVMCLNDLGKIVEEEWSRTPVIRPEVELDEFVIMPNHIHGILILSGDRRGVSRCAPTKSLRSPSQSLGAIVRGFKSASTKRINTLRNVLGSPVWQRSFYDHVIRNDADLFRIRTYIRNNPLQWALDEENPINVM